MNTKQESVPFSKSRVFITLILHLIMGVPSSLIPEVNIGLWLKVNIGLAIGLGLVNAIIWVLHKHDSKRYFSLHSFVMLWGIGFYLMAPIYKFLYPSIFFWLLLIATLVFMAFLLFKSEMVAMVFLNPQNSRFKNVMLVYSVMILTVGGLIWAYILATESAPLIPVAIILFLLGLFLIMFSPALLTTPERARELEQ